MYPAHTQLLAKWSSPSIGDQRATGCLDNDHIFCPDLWRLVLAFGELPGIPPLDSKKLKPESSLSANENLLPVSLSVAHISKHILISEV